MSGDMEKVGILSMIKLSTPETDLLLRYMGISKSTEVFDVMNIYYGDDFLRFIDVFSGETIKVPTREEIYKICNYIKIYNYVANKGFTEESIEQAAKIFDRRRNSIKRILNKVNSVMAKEEKYDDGTEQ